ncbi:MAG: sulfite exporter TauE/SafE family protein [Agriterribacter sp.]
MDNAIILLITGLLIGTLGTLIGAGGGFLLVPLLMFTHPNLTPEIITAISIALVAANAISGSIAYARAKRIDYKAGILFALFTIPGSILGVYVTKYIPQHTFSIIFGIILVGLSLFLFFKKNAAASIGGTTDMQGLTYQILIDRERTVFEYAYSRYIGILVSILVGFLSPLLGIGGGIIHVPAMVHWLGFPVYVATATSHFILAIMSTVSIVVHAVQGNYNDPAVLHMILWLAIGAVIGAQAGAFLSHKIKTTAIIKSLAVCLGLVGIRLLLDFFSH